MGDFRLKLQRSDQGPNASCWQKWGAFIKSNQHLDILPEILPEFSKRVGTSFNHGLSPSEVDWGDSKENLQKCSRTHQMDVCSWKLTGRPTPHVDACSWK